jgi:pimeloyl-ACP methyl ester carboxylesterase
MQKLKKRWWLLPLAFLALLILALLGFVLWGSTPAPPMPEALSALESDAQVRVDTEPWLAFQPITGTPKTGLILYPGGRVDPRAYAPTARALAAEGYLVVIVPMPLNFAILAPGRAAEVQAAFPQIAQWAIGGHSLGGAMAANYAFRQPAAMQGLALWAAYPASSDDLSSRQLAVTSIYGTQDGIATWDEIAASEPLLPPSTRWVEIEGGNHAQFGWYGPQNGDNPATISREAQQAQIVRATLDLLSQLDQ